MRTTPAPPRPLVLACGALAREVREILVRDSLGQAIDLECLPAELHNRPSGIAEALESRLARRAARGPLGDVLIGYADCGSGGAVQQVADRWGATMLDGPHCYSVFAGSAVFDALHDDEPGTFYLTDYLVRFFDRWVWRGLGLDRHPQLRDAYFGNYTRLLYLSQLPTPALLAAAEDAAHRLDLRLEHRHVGMGELAPAVVQLGPRQREGATA